MSYLKAKQKIKSISNYLVKNGWFINDLGVDLGLVDKEIVDLQCSAIENVLCVLEGSILKEATSQSDGFESNGN